MGLVLGVELVTKRNHLIKQPLMSGVTAKYLL